MIAHVEVSGRVQGVGYRAWTEDLARKLNLEGWVRNRPDGSVEAVFSGPEETIARAIDACRRGPAGARVDAVEAEEGSSALFDQRRAGERFSVLPTA